MVNRTAGTGQGESAVGKLASVFMRGLNQLSDVKVESVDDHPSARARAAAFVSESEAPRLLLPEVAAELCALSLKAFAPQTA